MVRDVVEDQLAINATLPRTLIGLLFRPGFLTREYLEERIARYIPPFRLYLASSLLFFVILPFIADFDRLWEAMEPHVEEATRGQSIAGTASPGMEGEAETIPPGSGVDRPAEPSEEFALVRSNIDTTAVPGWLKPLAGRYVRQAAKINAMTPREGTRVMYEGTTENVPRVIFLLLPLFALFLRVMYWRRVYAEHFVFALHFHAFVFLLAAVALVAQNLVVLVVLTCAVLVYLFVALKRVYQQPWVVTAAKYLVLLTVYFFVFAYAVVVVAYTVVLTA